MRHDTISPVDEAIPCIIGVGSECVNGRRILVREPSEDVVLPLLILAAFLVEELCIMLFTASYVVKNAPARCRLNRQLLFPVLHPEQTYKMELLKRPHSKHPDTILGKARRVGLLLYAHL